ncbi:hypothetical protein ACFQY7_54820 [Actinomadura luteofluorescens]|uniref:hypothetical protein n=1 Tax=Actinomadura luteofluorescens TaxID=46163 RepID=UPI0036321160
MGRTSPPTRSRTQARFRAERFCARARAVSLASTMSACRRAYSRSAQAWRCASTAKYGSSFMVVLPIVDTT